MRSWSRFVVSAAVTLMIGGCSHGTTSEIPTAPTSVTPAPVVTLRRLTVTPTSGGTLIAGGAAAITSSGPLPTVTAAIGAYAEFSDGSAHYVEGNWTTSDADVLIVRDATVRAIARGTATLTATAGGHTATGTFIVEPGIPGAWTGTYVVDQCAAGGGSISELICSAIPGRQRGMLAVGSVAPISFEVRQSGIDLTATAAFGDVRGTLTGSDRGQNFLTLRGDLTLNTTTITVFHWDSHVKTDVMEGNIGFEVRIAGIPSHAQVTGHFVDVRRR